MSDDFNPNLAARQSRGARWRLAFLSATILSVLFLVALIASVVDKSFGYVLTVAEVESSTLERDGIPLERQEIPSLVETIRENITRRLFLKLDADEPFAGRSRPKLLAFIEAEVVKARVVATWSLSQSLFSRKDISAFKEAEAPQGRLFFRSWANGALISNAQSSTAMLAGIRGAILGSLLTIFFTILIALPLGIGAAIYLEEYARDSRLNRIIQTNIYNLAGVPSIIYGMLGLALFVRGLEPLTSGALFGVGSAAHVGGGANGRTILSASLTLAILILPIVIINAQEAIKAVPASLRQSSIAVGATKWQTILHHVLPASIDRILTGAVLAISRALGETAPLVVIGASTFLSQDPTGAFSKFTTLPIQIYQWTARPQPEFRNLAAASILVLLVLLLSLNAAAIILRNKYRKEKRLGR
jgi:phosphate transport system permease protein